jgi:hypothetical protein
MLIACRVTSTKSSIMALGAFAPNSSKMACARRVSSRSFA